MNYVQIKQLLVIAKYMNLTKAAKELFITQPALSHSLSKIEGKLGFNIFFRDSNRLVLTEEGRMILKEIENVADAYDKMFDHARIMSCGKKEKIVLGFSGSVIAFYSLNYYGFFSSYKGIPIEKVFANKETLENMLQNGMADVAISFPAITCNNIDTRILLRDPYRLAVPIGHPLMQLPKIRLEDLEDYTLLTITPDQIFTSVCRDAIQKKNAALKFKEYSYSEFTKLLEKGASQKDIISITTKKQFSIWFSRGYCSVPIADFDEELTTGISWLRDMNFPYEYKGLLEEIEKKFDRIYYRNYRRLSFK